MTAPRWRNGRFPTPCFPLTYFYSLFSLSFFVLTVTQLTQPAADEGVFRYFFNLPHPKLPATATSWNRFLTCEGDAVGSSYRQSAFLEHEAP
jgi:hypothetical protein